MAKGNGLQSLVGIEDVVVTLRLAHVEEISGKIVKEYEHSYSVFTNDRGSGYTHNVPKTAFFYVKGELNKASAFKVGDEITAEVQTVKVVKRKGEILSTDENGFVLSYVAHMRNVSEYFATTAVQSVLTSEYTKEGAAAAKERSQRMAESRGAAKAAPVAKPSAKVAPAPARTVRRAA